MPSIDVTAYAGLLMTLLLAVCFALLVAMRDPSHAEPRHVSYTVRCPRYRRTAVVEFNESVRTGLILRSVSQCPLRRPGERCQACAWRSQRAWSAA